MTHRKHAEMPEEMVAALRKGGCPRGALWIVRFVLRDTSPDTFSHWMSEASQEGLSQCIERLQDGNAAVLLIWLETATRGIAIAPKRRIYEEIADHYDEAVGRAVASGLGKDEAQVSAVRELGNPHEANKAFRRAYLTEGQACRLSHCPAPLGVASLLRVFAFPMYILVIMFWHLVGTRGVVPSTVVPALAFLGLYAYVTRAHIPALLRNGLYRRVMLWKTAIFDIGVFVYWLVNCSWCVYFEAAHGTFPAAIAVAVSIGCLIAVLCATAANIPILRKLPAH